MEEISAAPGDDLLVERKRLRSDSAEDSDSLAAKRIRYDLLDILEDNDTSATAAQDLDSVMRSFESEITGAPAPPPDPALAVVDLASDPGDSQPDLGYLLEASDDELGLPPPSSSSSSGEEEETKNEVNGFDDVLVVNGFDDHQIWNFDDEIPICYEFGMGGDGVGARDSSVSDFVALDGLFDYSDVLLCGQSDFSDVSRQQPETLPAL